VGGLDQTVGCIESVGQRASVEQVTVGVKGIVLPIDLL
jgi:hypothetical protein